MWVNQPMTAPPIAAAASSSQIKAGPRLHRPAIDSRAYVYLQPSLPAILPIIRWPRLAVEPSVLRILVPRQFVYPPLPLFSSGEPVTGTTNPDGNHSHGRCDGNDKTG